MVEQFADCRLLVRRLDPSNEDFPYLRTSNLVERAQTLIVVVETQAAQPWFPRKPHLL